MSEQGYLRLDCTGDDLVAAADQARNVVAQGQCIVLPTDTVYGIGADAFNADAVRRLLAAKHRGPEMPPPVLVGESAVFDALTTSVSAAARALAQRFWPGALTLICRAQPTLSMDLGDTHGTVAIRVPDDPVARAVSTRTGPLAVSSANVSGQPPATTVDQAIAQLGDSVALYLDAGPARGVGASTIVDCVDPDAPPLVRRSGAISLAQLRTVVPDIVVAAD